MIGATTSQTLDLTLIKKGDMIYGTSTIKVEIGLKVGSTIEYIPMGIYNIDDIEKTDYTIKITAFDNMIKFERNFSTNLGENLTLQQVVSELERITGVQFTGSLPSYTVKKLEGFTCREILGYVASLCGGNAVITREGKFTIVTPNDINYSINTSNYFDYKREETKYKIGKISCQVGEEVLSKGSLGTDSMELQFENPWVTNSILQDIYNKLNGFEYLGYSMKWQGDLSLDLGDIVTITDKKGVVRKHPILSQKFNYTGGLTSEISAKGENKNKNEFSSSGSTAKKVERVVMELALINKALIDVAYIGDLTAGNIKFDTASGNTLDLQTLLSKFVTGENGQFLNITSSNTVIANAVIKDAMIDTISASKINTGVLDTNLVTVQGSSGNLLIKDNTIQIKDNNRVRVQIGKDASNDYSMYVWDSNGKLMFDATGLKADGIKDKIIRDDMVADNANINGSKINISSLISEFNKDTNTNLLKASKVAFDSTGQSLEVSFNSLKSVADDTKSKTESNTTSINAINGQIATLISDTTIEEDGATVKLKDSYSNLKQTVSGINATIASHSTSISNLTNNLNAVSEKVTKVNNKVSTIETNLNSITSRVSSTESSITNINGNISSLETRLSTAEQKITDSAIINTVSRTFLSKNDAASTYATKSSLTQTANDITFKFSQNGGYNIVKNGGFKNGLSGWWEAEYLPNGTNRSVSVWSDSNEWVLDGTYALVMRSTNHTSGEYRVDSQKFKVKKYTNYTLSYWVSAHRVTEIGHYIRGNEWSILDIMKYCPKTGGKNRSNWTRITHTFNTGNNHQISINFIHFITGNDAYSWITDVIINEGEVALPWSPHPSEIYEGNTTIDANGVSIKNGAITIKNNAGTTVLQGDSNGNLKMSIFNSVFEMSATGKRKTTMHCDFYDKFHLKVPFQNAGAGFKFESDTGRTFLEATAGTDYLDIPIWTKMSSLSVSGTTYVVGNFSVSGSKNSLQKTKNYGEKLINAYETAEYYFGDIGSGIIKDGECIVYIDDILQECINTNCDYHVFTQIYNGSISGIKKYPNYFIVFGEEETRFSWELKAKRIGYENVRLDSPDIEVDREESDITESILLEGLNFKLDDYLLDGGMV